jgi:hypothetical protein
MDGERVLTPTEIIYMEKLHLEEREFLDQQETL